MTKTDQTVMRVTTEDSYFVLNWIPISRDQRHISP